MRWPFISRATHDALMAVAREHAAVAMRLYDKGKAREDEVWERLRVVTAAHDAFVAAIAEHATPKAAPIIVAPKPREPDAADHAIALASAFDPRRRRHLEQFVRARRSEGKDAQDIAQEVLHPKADGMGEWEMPE